MVYVRAIGTQYQSQKGCHQLVLHAAGMRKEPGNNDESRCADQPYVERQVAYWVIQTDAANASSEDLKE
jgi:hypothetical protein